MKALVYHGPQKKSWEEKPKPVIKEATDAIVTHHFKLNQVVEAYDTFGNAATEKALKVILTNE